MEQIRIVRPADPDAPPLVDFDQWTEAIATGYPVGMTPRQEGKTPQRVIRIDDATWAAFELVCAARGISRSDAVRMLIKQDIEAFERKRRQIARESAPPAVQSAEG